MHVLTARIRQWRKKVKKYGSIRKETYDNPGAGVSIYQLQSAHSVFVPQFSGKLTSAHIWAVQVMVDHFSDLIYVLLIIITTQYLTLSGNTSFERWAAIFGVKFCRYHADNVIFSEYPSRSEIEDSNQTITFYGVGYHHQNAIVERKFKL